MDDEGFSLPNASEIREAWNKSYIQTSFPKKKHIDLVSLLIVCCVENKKQYWKSKAFSFLPNRLRDLWCRL